MSIALPGRDYAHYYQLWIPALALGAGLFAGRSRRTEGVRPSVLSRGLRWTVGGATLVALGLRVGPSFFRFIAQMAG